MTKNLEQKEQENFVGGNTITPTKNKKNIKKQVVQSKSWCFTLNNYLEQDIICLKEKFEILCLKWIIGKEIGEQGTPHLQGYIHLHKKARPSEFKLNNKIHWERCKGTETDNIIYCSKDNNFIKSKNIIIPKPLKIIKELRPWQADLEKMLEVEPNDRDIIWIYEGLGKVGKSSFARYMMYNYDSLYITEGKKTDVINLVYNYVLVKELNVVIVDIPRDNENSTSYKALEEIKNGIICNTKYETGSKLINPPHIVVFSNFQPEYEKFSLDRWKIYEIVNNKLVLEDINNTDKFDNL